jgi:hypothetical protein
VYVEYILFAKFHLLVVSAVSVCKGLHAFGLRSSSHARVLLHFQLLGHAKATHGHYTWLLHRHHSWLLHRHHSWLHFAHHRLLGEALLLVRLGVVVLHIAVTVEMVIDRSVVANDDDIAALVVSLSSFSHNSD